MTEQEHQVYQGPEGGEGAEVGDDDTVAALFHELDEDDSGELDMDEVRKLCKRLGQKLDNRSISRAFREMDADASGAVDLQEFRNWWEESVTKPSGAFHQFLALTELAKQIKVGASVRLKHEPARCGTVRTKRKKSAEVDFGG